MIGQAFVTTDGAPFLVTPSRPAPLIQAALPQDIGPDRDLDGGAARLPADGGAVIPLTAAP